MYNGIINVYKEKDYTSHDVVAILKGMLSTRKIGHTGTLDPQAEGVLPVCVGGATKVCDIITDTTKEYEATLLLGRATDTDDIYGEIIGQREVNVSEEDVRTAVMSFTGDIMQIPPMYAAIKVDGRKLYDIARSGRVIERKPRPVTISRITILGIDLPSVRFLVECSRGTYIRSLCRDIGEKLGCLGCMSALIRTRSGYFRLDSARKLSELQRLCDDGRAGEAIVGADVLFPDLPVINADDEVSLRMVDNGNMFSIAGSRVMDADNKAVLARKLNPREQVRVYVGGVFRGIYSYDASLDYVRPVKILYQK